MGRIGNALKRGLTNGDKGRKKGMTGRLAGGCLGTLLFLVVIYVCLTELLPSLISEWTEERIDAAAAAAQQIVSQAQQQALKSMTVEEMVVNDVELPPMSKEMKKNVLLQTVSVEELVMGTLIPFGEMGDGDERFTDITIRTEVIRIVRKHPSEEEVAAFRQNEYESMYAAKKQAMIEAAEEGAVPSATPTSAPSVTAAPPVQKPGQKKKGTGAPGMTTMSMKGTVKAATSTAAPSATPTPLPEPTWDEKDEEILEQRVKKYMERNTYTEEMSGFVTRTIDGEKLRAYLNSFHTPWQSNYSEAAFIAMFDYGYEEGTETSIEPEIAERVFGYGNMLEYHLYLDYWSDTDYWTGTDFLYDERDSVFGGDKKAYEEYEDDYSDAPVVIDEKTDLISEKGFVPLVLFNDISDWAVKTTYGNRLDSRNGYDIYMQEELIYETSTSFNAFSESLEFKNVDLDLFVDSFGRMPECEDQQARLRMVAGLYKPGNYSSGVMVSNFAYLSGNGLGADAAYRAMEIVATNPVYSNPSREKDGYYDCSSFVARVYEDLGIGVFRSGGWSFDTEALLHYFDAHPEIVVVQGGWPDDESVLQPGDILLYAKAGKPKDRGVYHAAMWIGNGYIADASSSLGHVVYRQMWGKDEIIVITRPSLLNVQ